MATTSPVCTTVAWNTTPNDPLPMMRSALYETVVPEPDSAPSVLFRDDDEELDLVGDALSPDLALRLDLSFESDII